MTRTQQHTWVRGSCTAKSPLQLEGTSACIPTFYHPTQSVCFPWQSQGGRWAGGERCWGRGERTIQLLAHSQAAWLQHKLALQFLGQLLRQEGPLKLPGAGAVLWSVGHSVANVAHFNSKGIFMPCSKRNHYNLCWIDWGLAKLHLPWRKSRFCGLACSTFSLSNLRIDAFLHIYTGINLLLADTELLYLEITVVKHRSKIRPIKAVSCKRSSEKLQVTISEFSVHCFYSFTCDIGCSYGSGKWEFCWVRKTKKIRRESDLPSLSVQQPSTRSNETLLWFLSEAGTGKKC